MASSRDLPTASIQLTHLMVAQPDGATLHTSADATSPVVARLQTGSVCVSLAEVTTATGEHWSRVIHGVEGHGYLNASDVTRIRAISKSPFFHGDRFILMRAPRQTFPEPKRNADSATLDTTFTITFNGRIGPFFEAMGSVLQHLGDVGCIADWVVICDGGATAEQREEILHALPWVSFVGKGAGLHRHPVSMNIQLALVRTRWWLQWEDDWCLDAPIDLLTKARDAIAHSNVHQLAINSAWQRNDALWGTCEPAMHLAQHTTARGVEYAEVLYPEDQRQRLLADESVDELIDGYLSGMRHLASGGGTTADATNTNGVSTPLLWPLYSNQPSLNDAAFMRTLLPFNEDPSFSPPHRYWTFEFDFGVRFIRAGGRKATLLCPPGGAARRIDCSSSSYGTVLPPDVQELMRHVTPPTKIEMPLAPLPEV